MSSIKKNLKNITTRLQICPDKKINILAVSKYATLSQINEAYNIGLRHFGESRLQDAIPKIESLKKPDIQWHFIGHVQRNKAKRIVTYFNSIQSIDSLPLLERIQQIAHDQNKKISVYLQVNIANEPQKFGFNPNTILTQLPNPKDYPNLMINGIMIMLPKEKSHEYCKKASELYISINKKIKTLKTLSMGMSQDYGITIQHNANEIRIGSALFKE